MGEFLIILAVIFFGIPFIFFFIYIFLFCWAMVLGLFWPRARGWADWLSHRMDP